MSFSSGLTRSCLALVLVVSLGGCAAMDSLIHGRAATQPETKVLTRPPAPAPKKPVSRLDSQPWPTTMGQPYAAPKGPIETAPLETLQETALPTKTKDGVTRVALLAPLSGKHAALGQAMANAAQLAVFEVSNGHFELLPRDTAGRGATAESAARDAMASGAELLIGPVFAPDVTAVKQLVQTSDINMLALSTDVSLGEPGVYVMGFAPAPQVERVVAYAGYTGMKRYAAVIPAGAYGALVEKAFRTAVGKAHGKIMVLTTPDKLDALIEKKDQLDALLLPFGGTDLKQITDTLAAQGINGGKIRFLGTGLWDTPDLATVAPAALGGWYAASDPAERAAFLQSYEAAYGAAPPRLATLAYDATALAAALAARNIAYDRASLENPHGFAGLDGIFRLLPEGQTERALAILEVTQQGPTTLDPAQRKF